MIYQHSKLGIL
ncbi:UNVERIFIED_CONTAM: hypothetical protein GTU68_004194 [Idotea baltica]|nr:hypothetical protein [Idotea baltica]